jgi:hypothetical protein
LQATKGPRAVAVAAVIAHPSTTFVSFGGFLGGKLTNNPNLSALNQGMVAQRDWAIFYACEEYPKRIYGLETCL